MLWLLAGSTLFASVAAAIELPSLDGSKRSANVEARLIVGQSHAVPGQTFTVGLHLKMDEGWHTYWRNPGTSGLPTTIDWDLPDGFEAGPIQWPAPQWIDMSGYATYGYEGEVLLLTEISVAEDVPPGSYQLNAAADWLSCKEACIPGSVNLEIIIKIRDEPTRPADDVATLFDRARASLPIDPPAGAVQALSQSSGDIALHLEIDDIDFSKATVRFFPSEQDAIDLSAQQELRVQQIGHAQLLLERSDLSDQPIQSLDGVLTLKTSDEPLRVWRIDLPVN